MADDKPMLDPKTYPTLIAVVFFMAILSLLLNFWNYQQVMSLAVGSMAMDEAVQNTTEESHELDALSARVDKLEAMAKEMEAKAAAAPAGEEMAKDGGGGQ